MNSQRMSWDAVRCLLLRRQLHNWAETHQIILFADWSVSPFASQESHLYSLLPPTLTQLIRLWCCVCVCVFLHACTSTSIHIPLFRRPGLVNFGGWVRGNINICPEWSDYKRTALSTSVHMWNFASLHAYQMTTWWSDLTSTLFMLLITSQYFLHKERHILFSICWINRENKLINILL